MPNLYGGIWDDLLERVLSAGRLCRGSNSIGGDYPTLTHFSYKKGEIKTQRANYQKFGAFSKDNLLIKEIKMIKNL